jgi:hypothetical protein
MKLGLYTLFLTLFAIILSSVTSFFQIATIATDQADYTPGSTATIAGSGFQADVPANSTLQIGNNYNSGIYFIEVIQGRDRAVLRLAKVS